MRRSSDLAMRGFCSVCGTALLWQGDAGPGEIDVTAGSLDRPEAIAPQDHLWTESAVPWFEVERRPAALSAFTQRIAARLFQHDAVRELGAVADGDVLEAEQLGEIEERRGVVDRRPLEDRAETKQAGQRARTGPVRDRRC